MPSIRQILGAVAVGLVASAVALPTKEAAFEIGRLARKQMLQGRQNPATGLPDGLTDVDILELYVSLSDTG